MPKWFGKESIEVPDGMENLTPEQIIELARAGQGVKALQDKVTDLEGKLTTSATAAQELATAREQLQAATQKAAELEQRLNPQQQTTPQRVSFLEDEDAAFNQRIQPVVGGVFAIGAQVSQMTFENGLKGLDRKIYDKFNSEVKQLMSKEPPQNQASPYAWQTAFDIIKGRHVSDIAKAAEDKTDFFAAESVGSPDAGPQKAPNLDVITDDDKAMAKKFGITPEQYKEQQKEMVIYHG